MPRPVPLAGPFAVPLAAPLLWVAACAAPALPHPDDRDLRAWIYVPDLPITDPPYDRVHASWKQRMNTPYLFMEHRGSYTGTGSLIPVVHREMVEQGLEPDGPPFCLFYDDPAEVPTDQLRSRACIPVRGPRAVLSPLGYEVLESTTVGYAFVSGAYPDAPRAYPGIFEYLDRMNWVLGGPIREIYLVPPGADPVLEELLCEVQVPARPAAR